METPERALFNKRLDNIRLTSFRNKIVRYFPETDLRNGHDGLAKLAEKNGIDLGKLKAGEFAVFVNKKQTAVKMFAFGYVIAHLRMPGSNRINPKVISLLPRFFDGREIDYEGALKAVMKEQFPSFFEH